MTWAGKNRDFEFQRLHGMGEGLHEHLVQEEGYRCRTYAPVGGHRDLLAYLVCRLLVNGANSSFVHQLADTDKSDAALLAVLAVVIGARRSRHRVGENGERADFFIPRTAAAIAGAVVLGTAR